MSQRQVRPQPPRRQATESAGAPKARTDALTLTESIDELLEEIDAVLEEQAVLVNFRQRGGQ
jgi:Pup-like protein